MPNAQYPRATTEGLSHALALNELGHPYSNAGNLACYWVGRNYARINPCDEGGFHVSVYRLVYGPGHRPAGSFKADTVEAAIRIAARQLCPCGIVVHASGQVDVLSSRTTEDNILEAVIETIRTPEALENENWDTLKEGVAA